ncbi:RibD family protein, partial [Caenispirillum bisanense]|uniref:RibD family protein n=1 Tax=Caenispirillum bisanense TaxID=414052 RepID=UPI0031DBF547
MSLDADAAWRLVLALRHRPCDRHGAADVTVRPDGSWGSSQPVGAVAAALLDLYLPLAADERWVVGHLGQSLDGRIACSSGHSASLTGGANIDHLHRLLALADAVVVGAGTALADDPQLTTRRVAGPSPVRVIVAGRRPLDPGLGLFTDGRAPT